MTLSSSMPSGKWRFNFLDWEASRPEAGGGLTINIVAILDEIAGAIASSAARTKAEAATTSFGRMPCTT